MSYMRNLKEIGTSIIGRAVTQTFYVCPDGADTDTRISASCKTNTGGDTANVWLEVQKI